MTDETPWVVENLEQLDDGLTREWFKDGRVIAYRLTSVTTETLNLWADTIINSLETWPEEQPYLAIHDFSARKVSLSYAVRVKHHVLNIGATPAGLTRVQEILADRPRLVARVALVFSPTFSGNLGHTFARHDRGDDQFNVDYKVCFETSAAFRWLGQDLE